MNMRALTIDNSLRMRTKPLGPRYQRGQKRKVPPCGLEPSIDAVGRSNFMTKSELDELDRSATTAHWFWGLF